MRGSFLDRHFEKLLLGAVFVLLLLTLIMGGTAEAEKQDNAKKPEPYQEQYDAWEHDDEDDGGSIGG